MSTIVDNRNIAEDIRAAFHQSGNEADPRRLRAFQMLMQKGLPHAKTEEYKFTPVTRLLEQHLVFTETPSAPEAKAPIPSSVENFKSNRIVFLNGRYAKDQSIIIDDNLRIQLSNAPEPQPVHDPFDLLNQAFHHEFVEITVNGGEQVRHPLVILYTFDTTDFAFANPRWRCTLHEKSSLTLVEQSASTAKSRFFNNKQSLIEVGPGASLDYVIIENTENDLFVGNSFVHLATSARASCYTFTFAGQMVRNNLTMTIQGERVEAHLYGLYLLSDQTHADNHTVVDHQVANSYSNELYKGVMDGRSRGVFNGKIYVRPHAQKTNAFQSNRNILLGESASIHTKPQLEIWADDVKCSHGCTTGQLDEDALFYLRSRGIPKEMAKGMMLYAFAAETISTIRNEQLRNLIDAFISEKLRKNF